VRAVWSFWSRPYYTGHGWGWREPVHHHLAWGLSLRSAREHYPDTVLITDTPGKALLVDKLGLSFAHVSTELDRLRDADPALWALGKLVAYSVQDEPFVHLDSDVFLWQPLPDRVTSAPVLAQHPEPRDSWGPQVVEDAFARASVSLPVAWQWSRSHSGHRFRQANCGILGGINTSFISCYARLALDLALNPTYSAAWAVITDRQRINFTLEQFLLSACVDFHRFDPESPHRGIELRYLFPTNGAAYDPTEAARLGFTHLLGPAAKQDARVTTRLEQRVRRDNPAFYRRCQRVAGSSGQPRSDSRRAKRAVPHDI
jgi:hypothetical protein